ncbi:MAG: ferrochelatase [Burkholderiales bacterium]|jgi:ferrochelatase|nr:ferrochelatase [Burkholderiales bacterium]
MPRYLPEPSSSSASSRIGILLINMGTPDAPTASAVCRYLTEFLSDPRIIEMPRWLWKPILHGIILRTRPAKSAEKYRQIWTNEGSPLLVHTQAQRDMLQGYLGEALKKEGLSTNRVIVEMGMRYGHPSVAHSIEALRQQGCTSLLVLPLYPQYAASTTGSSFDAVATCLQRRRFVPELRMIGSYAEHPAYIKALKERVQKYWQHEGFTEHLLMSFHGAPEKTREDGDPYYDECCRTAQSLATQLGLKKENWTLSFQSRFGRAQWLQPYTFDVLAALGKKKLRRIHVICPGFASDCLETIEEIGIGGKDVFQKAGGGEFCLIPCLNDFPPWISAMVDILMPELRGILKPQAAPPPAEIKRVF